MQIIAATSWPAPFSSVVVDNLDIVCIALREPKADPPLIVHSNAELSGAIALQCFEPIVRRDPQFADRNDAIQDCELPHRSRLQLFDSSIRQRSALPSLTL
jgi:hypothetical protein